jgi:glycosyltransferase involved in cell wall biosynthesis
VLLVAYEFPPVRSSGVYRPLKWARYLPEFGWEPVILTACNPRAVEYDYSLMAELPPDIALRRVPAIELDRLEQLVYDRVFQRSRGKAALLDSFPGLGAASSDASGHSLSWRGVSRVARWARSFLYVPDARIGWLPAAVVAGLRTRFDAIVTTSPPASTHLVGLILAGLTRKPWIADFRDPWTDNFDVLDLPPFRHRWDRVLEALVLRRAARIVNVGASFSALSRQSFPGIPAAKHVVIPNGYDESDFAGLEAAPASLHSREAPLRLVNVGTIYSNSAFNTFLDGLERVLREEAGPAPSVILELIGGGQDLTPAQIQRLTTPPFAGHVVRQDFMPHREALQAMMAADVLLLIPSGGTPRTSGYVIPGKTFELMRCGRPILMIGWPGEAADIVTRSGLGELVLGDQPDGVADAIRRFRERKRQDGLSVSPDWGFIRQYERRHLTARLAALLDQLRDGTGAPA